MKMIMQIIGAKVIKGSCQNQNIEATVEVYCIPFTSTQVKPKKIGLMELASGGSLQQIIEETQKMNTNIMVFHCSMGTWLSEFKNKLLTKIELEVKPVVFMED
jgi:hypothetical protein